MSAARILILARRVIKQVVRDRRTLIMVILVPIFVLTLGALLLRADPAPVSLAVVNEDEGVTVPVAGALHVADRIVTALAESDAFDLSELPAAEADARLRDGSVQAVLTLPATFTADFIADRHVEPALMLEGSNPTRSRLIVARVQEAAMKALAGMASAGLGAASSAGASADGLPVAVAVAYLYGGEQFDTVDYIAPVYIAFLGLFFVFLLSCVSFLRERSQGTMERLLATPATRQEIVLGYMLGLSLFALVQVSVILFYTIWALDIHYLGSLALVFVVVLLLALVGISLGMVASAFARNEFQVMQFIPLLIIPQVLLAGTFWAVEEMPGWLRPLSYLMPLTYANFALRDVMLKGLGLPEIWPHLLVLVGFVALLTVLGAVVMRSEVA